MTSPIVDRPELEQCLGGGSTLHQRHLIKLARRHRLSYGKRKGATTPGGLTGRSIYVDIRLLRQDGSCRQCAQTREVRSWTAQISGNLRSFVLRRSERGIKLPLTRTALRNSLLEQT